MLDEPIEIDQFQNDMAQENTVEEQKEPQDEDIFEDVEQSKCVLIGFQKEEVHISSQQNFAKLEVMRIESIVHMNDQWIELNGGGLLPAQNTQNSNSCTAGVVTALCMLYVLLLVECYKHTINYILNTGY
jgi:hypothetical protein